MISVVIPAYNEQENIPAAAERLGGILAPLDDYELIFVDDGSRDGTWELIKQLGETDEHIRGLHFPRREGRNSLRLPQHRPDRLGPHGARGDPSARVAG